MRERPWYKRYPSNFLQGVHGLGPKLIGAYSVILDVIYDRGGACPDDPKWIGAILGCSGREARALIDGLVSRAKLYLDEAGNLRNQKADEILRSSSVSPPTSPPKNTAEKGVDVPRHVPRHVPRDTESIAAEINGLPDPSRARARAGGQRIEDREEERRTEGSAKAGADAPWLDTRKTSSTKPPLPSNPDKAWLFRDGLEYLARATGRAESAQRPLIGKWLARLKDDAATLREVFEACQREEPGDPVSWLTSAVTSRVNGNGSAPPRRANDRFHEPHYANLDGAWRLALQGFINTGIWSDQNGPSPLLPGCRVPARLLTEFAPKLERLKR